MAESREAPTPQGAAPLSRLIAAIGSPVALGTALLLYFGWVRSQAQAQAFGADASVFEMSPQDLVLRSINVLFYPVILLLLVWLLLFRLDRSLRPAAPRVAPALRWSWLVILPGLMLARVAPSVGSLTLPLWMLLAIGGTAYGNLLRRVAAGDHSPPRLSVIVAIGGLVTVALFWQTERMAKLAGETLAKDMQNNLAAELPMVSLFSVGRLQLDAPGLTESPVQGPDAAYHYRYDGLYLLQRSGGKYFLVTGGWSEHNGRLLVLRDTDSFQLEFRSPQP